MYLIYNLISRFSSNSLRNQAREAVRKENIELYDSYLSESTLYKFNRINTLRGSFVTYPLIILILSIFCIYPIFEYFPFIVINKTDAAENIKDGIQNSSSLIGISFIVIGFLFEIAKNRAQVTLQEFFTSIKLYFVLSLSLSIVLFHVIVNAIIPNFNSLENQHVIRNFGILSSFLMAILVIGIAYLFFNLVSVFSPDGFAKFSSKTLTKSAKKRVMEELIILKSKEIYCNIFNSLSYPSTTYFFKLHAKGSGCYLLTGGEKILYDVRIKTLKKHFLKYDDYIKKNSSSMEYRILELDKRFFQSEAIFYSGTNDFFKNKELEVNRVYKLIKPSYSENSFEQQQKNLLERLRKAAKLGNLEGIERQLEDIQSLYNINYQSK